MIDTDEMQQNATSLQEIENAEALRRALGRKFAEEQIAAEALAEVRGARVRKTMADLANEPQPLQPIKGILAAEVNNLGGPTGEGKSLLARDWALHIAAGVQWHGHDVVKSNVLWVASEGMHDVKDRWAGQPLWDLAKDSIEVQEAVNLTMTSDVDWMLDEYEALRPGLVVFDVIYGMGMSDDNGVKDALPVLNSMKRVSARWDCATLAIGHPPLGNQRRFRGSSMWRQLAYVEWHMAEGRLTCEKSKIANAPALTEHYAAEYPSIQWFTRQEARAEYESRQVLIAVDIEQHPNDSDRARAIRLAPALGVSEVTVRRWLRDHRNTG